MSIANHSLLVMVVEKVLYNELLRRWIYKQDSLLTRWLTGLSYQCHLSASYVHAINYQI